MSKKTGGNGCILAGCSTYALIQIGIITFLVHEFTLKSYMNYAVKSIIFSIAATILILLISYLSKRKKKNKSINNA